MAYDSGQLLRNVRALLSNIGSAQVPDSELALFAHHALSIIHVHRPRLVAVDIAGTDKNNYRIDNLTGWLKEFSMIQWIAEAVDISADELPVIIASGEYEIYGPTASGQTWLIFKDQIPTGTSVTVAFTGIWEILGLDDADTTTIVSPVLISALEYLTAHNVALTLSHAAAGFTARGIQADIVNYTDRREEYAMAAQQFYRQFEVFLQLVPEISAPAGGFFATKFPTDSDWPETYTHRRTRGY